MKTKTKTRAVYSDTGSDSDSVTDFSLSKSSIGDLSMSDKSNKSNKSEKNSGSGSELIDMAPIKVPLSQIGQIDRQIDKKRRNPNTNTTDTISIIDNKRDNRAKKPNVVYSNSNPNPNTMIDAGQSQIQSQLDAHGPKSKTDKAKHDIIEADKFDKSDKSDKVDRLDRRDQKYGRSRRPKDKTSNLDNSIASFLNSPMTSYVKNIKTDKVSNVDPKGSQSQGQTQSRVDKTGDDVKDAKDANDPKDVSDVKIVKYTRHRRSDNNKTGNKTATKTGSDGLDGLDGSNGSDGSDGSVSNGSYDSKDSNNSHNSRDSNDSNDSDDSNNSDESNNTDSETDSSDKKKKDKTTVPIKDAIQSAMDRARYAKVRRFFRDPTRCSKANVQMMVDIINKNYEISLRTINWFCTKHLDIMDSRYRANENGERELFDPKITYGKRLNNYGKKGFDPFRRGLAFDWNYDPSDKTKTVTTTLCQLQFFQWLFEYDLMDYIISHLPKLKDTMRKSEKKKKEIKKIKKDKKEKEIQAKIEEVKDQKNIKLKTKKPDTIASPKLVIKIG